MNETGARRVVAIVAGLALVLGFFAWHSHRNAAARRAVVEANRATAAASASRTSSRVADGSTSPPKSERLTAPTIELIARDPATAAKTYAGLAIGYAISGRWEKQARERLSCD